MQFASPSDGSLASTGIIMHGSCPVSPYPVKHYRGFMLPLTREFGFLAVSECKRFLIWFVVRVYIQLIVPCRSYPLGWHADALGYAALLAKNFLLLRNL